MGAFDEITQSLRIVLRAGAAAGLTRALFTEIHPESIDQNFLRLAAHRGRPAEEECVEFLMQGRCQNDRIGSFQRRRVKRVIVLNFRICEGRRIAVVGADQIGTLLDP